MSEDELWRLRDERDFLVRSLRDADLEHQAGDLATEDYQVLHRRDADRLAQVEAAIAASEEARTKISEDAGGQEAEGGSNPKRSPAARRRRRRNLLAAGGVVAIVAGIVILIFHVVSPRLPGQTSSGSLDLGTTQRVQRQLAQAAALVDAGRLAQALTVYQQVLKERPHQPQALAERGWLEYEAGVEVNQPALIHKGRASIEASIHAQPTGYPGHLYLGTIELQQDHNAAAAVGQFRLFLSEHPPKALVQSAAPFLRQAFQADHQPVPAQVPAAGSKSSAKSSAPSKSPKG